ncbi:methyltransferase [Leptospira langatensis]|uniref:Methyltransferase n=1 Tax=Leptospira langatensis TaxID=2484983 RepID=A0A5F1ZRE3_9LEPT|nr:methyltransferase [Leptospira langatensis]TGJ98934.1 methyltransferase [Leptospira langatensis]TGL40497.1 methyltransferase [Leptospira langatensis]
MTKDPNRKYGNSIYKEGLEDWIHSELVPRPFPWLKELEEKALQDKFPVLSPASGSVLAFLVASWKPDSILELGTGYGISLAWMISALSSFAKIVTVDREVQFIGTARSYLSRLDPKSFELEFKEGECLDALQVFLGSSPKQSREFLFVDCDKIRYPEILEKVLSQGRGRRLRVAFDNVLWHGRIMDPSNQAPSDIAVRKVWSLIQDSKLPYTLFPVGDGILCFDFSE